MTFDELLAQVLELLQRQGRVSYGALKRRFDLDDAYLEDLKTEIIEAQQLAVDEQGRILVWTGEAAVTPAPASAPVPDRAPLTYTPQHLAEKILTARSTMAGERKHVTVLFADIKGSTELIGGLDPEEALHTLAPIMQLLMDAVHQHNGFVNQTRGDGIMALFGAPIAEENHALQACQAALAMRASVERQLRRMGCETAIRIGLNSGDVIIQSIGSDLAMNYDAVGRTVHLAARMETLAKPGSILLGRNPRACRRLHRCGTVGLCRGEGHSPACRGVRAQSSTPSHALAGA